MVTYPSRWCVVLLALVASVAGSACESSSDTFVAPAGSRCTIAASTTVTSFPSGGGSGTVQVSTARECAWTARSDASWIALEGEAGGQGDGSVRFNIGGNPEPGARIAALTVSDVRMPISQDGRPCEFRLSSTHETLGASGGERTIAVEANPAACTWAVGAQVPWIAIAGPSSRTGNGDVRLDVSPTAQTRSGTILIAGHVVTLEQASCIARPATTSISVSPAGGGLEIPVTAPADCPWSVAAQVPWITIAGPSSRTGNGEVRLDVPATTQSRSGTILIAGQVVTIEQANCIARPATTSVSVSPGGGRLEIPVSAPADCPWSVSSEASWLTLASGPRGSGGGVVVVDAALNPGASRSGTIVVAGQNVVIQQASSCTGAPAMTAASVSAAGGGVEVPVLAGAGCTWAAQSESPWISITGASSGSGPGSVVLTAASTDGPSRQGSVNVSGVRVTVTQLSGCRYSAQPVSYTAAAAGVSASIALQTAAGCPWTAETSAAWISLSRISGEGPSTIPLVVAPNQSPSRTATVTLGGIPVSVLQGSLCSWSLAPPAVDYQADGGQGAILVLVGGGCTWTATSGVNWITVVTGGSGAGDGMVQIAVTANSGPARSGLLRIAGMDLIVRQSSR